ALPAWAQSPPSGGAGPAPTPITTLVAQVVAVFPKVEGDVMKVEGDQVTLSVGKRDGVVAGVELMVYREGEELKHPKTGEVLGRTEKTVGRLSITDVAEAYSTGRISQGNGVQPGDKARVSAGKVKLTVLPLSTGVRDTLIEAAIQELVDGSASGWVIPSVWRWRSRASSPRRLSRARASPRLPSATRPRISSPSISSGLRPSPTWTYACSSSRGRRRPSTLPSSCRPRSA